MYDPAMLQCACNALANLAVKNGYNKMAMAREGVFEAVVSCPSSLLLGLELLDWPLLGSQLMQGCLSDAVSM